METKKIRVTFVKNPDFFIHLFNKKIRQKIRKSGKKKSENPRKNPKIRGKFRKSGEYQWHIIGK